jgi:hypothetical protein
MIFLTNIEDSNLEKNLAVLRNMQADCDADFAQAPTALDYEAGSFLFTDFEENEVIATNDLAFYLRKIYRNEKESQVAFGSIDIKSIERITHFLESKSEKDLWFSRSVMLFTFSNNPRIVLEWLQENADNLPFVSRFTSARFAQDAQRKRV